MKRLSKKAGGLIIDLCIATSELTQKPLQPNLDRFLFARRALMEYIKDLEIENEELKRECEK